MIIPKGESLVTYYILPLVGVNKLTFGRSFKASYISKDGNNVYVELSKNMHTPVYKANYNYVTELMHGTTKFIMFSIPIDYSMDIEHFMNGAYSKFQSSTKKKLYTTSSLPYNATMGSFSVSSPVLQALDKTKTLRSWIESSLGIKPIPETSELIDPPREDWFIEHRFKICIN
jgi:hypothetical protein